MKAKTARKTTSRPKVKPGARRKPGRPSEIERVLRTAKAKLANVPVWNVERIASLLGCGRSSLARYLGQGRLDDDAGTESPFRELWGVIERGRARAYYEASKRVGIEVRKDARSAFKYLAVTDPANWAETTKQVTTHRGAIGVGLTVEDLHGLAKKAKEPTGVD